MECSAPANPPEVGDEAKTEEHLAETANKHEAKTDEVGEEEREGATEGTIAEATTEGGATVAEGAGGGEEPVGGNNDGNNSEEETEEDSRYMVIQNLFIGIDGAQRGFIGEI